MLVGTFFLGKEKMTIKIAEKSESVTCSKISMNIDERKKADKVGVL